MFIREIRGRGYVALYSRLTAPAVPPRPLPRLAPQLPLPAQPYLPASGRARPQLPISQALAADGAESAGFSPTLFAYGIDAFHAGCCWEAHECWEVLWRREPKTHARRALLQGMILLAAARVKARQGRPHGAAALHQRALTALERALAAPGPAEEGPPDDAGVDVAKLLRDARAAGAAAALAITAPDRSPR